MIRYIQAICSILVLLVLIISIVAFFVFGYDYNKENSRECAYFFEDFSDDNAELYYKKVNDLCCHFTLKDDMIIEECIPYD